MRRCEASERTRRDGARRARGTFLTCALLTWTLVSGCREGATPQGTSGAAPPANPEWMDDAGYEAPPLHDAGDDGGSDAQVPREPCTQQAEEVVACGLDPHALRARTCDGSFWSAWSECALPESCTGGERRERACGRNARGISSRECSGSYFGPWTSCADPDECRDGERASGSCGLNQRGAVALHCEAGRWLAFGACDDPDACVAGRDEVEACGPNRRGSRTRSCADGVLSAWSPCEDVDVCTNGDYVIERCGFNLSGATKRTCISGQWAAPSPCRDLDECVDGAIRTTVCGLNARGAGVDKCVNGLWKQTSCDDPDSCVDDIRVTTTCASDEALVQDYLCGQGVLAPASDCRISECAEGTVEVRSCGLNGSGKERRRCERQLWPAFDACVDPDQCVYGTSREVACGLNGRGVGYEYCLGSLAGTYFGNDSYYYPFVCSDTDLCTDGEASVRACGEENDGAVPILCVEGQWVDDGECEG